MVVATLHSGRRVRLHEEVGASAEVVVQAMVAGEFVFVRTTSGWVRVDAITMIEDASR